MVGVDYSIADIALREKMAFTDKEAKALLKSVIAIKSILGAVLLSTCNRTELYVSLDKKIAVSLTTLLWGNRNINIGNAYYLKEDLEAALHLMLVAPGLKSLIIGEDQIISQVKDALKMARDMGATDSVLETLFRMAVTAGKKIKTEVVFKGVPTSTVKNAILFLKKKIGNLAGKKALVIGNGEVGYEAAIYLLSEKVETTITLRQYKGALNKIPLNCKTIDYDKRLKKIEEVDFVISSTKSPHFTLTKEQLDFFQKKPLYLIDLAIPRDIDPKIENIKEITLCNIDNLGSINLEVLNQEALLMSQSIIESYLEDFKRWQIRRECTPVIESIKKEAALKINGSLNKYESAVSKEEMLSFIVNKTVDMLMFSLKEDMNKELLLKVQKALCNQKGER